MAWGDACDPDHEDSAALEFSPFRSLSPTRVQEVGGNFVEPIVFANKDLRPALEAYSTVSFGCRLGQERRSSPSYSELLDVVTRAVDKLGFCQLIPRRPREIE
ncbi:hypothetical protein G5714_006171 [Onychostoma macrolepis]|uniref:Uncharacterized protein n=1 Tax=Onychostoma macrolepis TaxID=369639 RepID=A0A7J6D337_9TELE|nr:hypothetical protein G5714_006171 [Onychostoma macrolepis]